METFYWIDHEPSPLDIDQMFRDKLLEQGCYEEILYTLFDSGELHYYRNRYLYKLKDSCMHRVIKRGYLRNKENKSMGKSLDFERAIYGY